MLVGTISDSMIASRWTRASGAVPIHGLQTWPPPFPVDVTPDSVSANGSVIVGRGPGILEPPRDSVYRWTQQTGLQELSANLLTGLHASVSGNGKAVAGFGSSSGFRWTQETGTKSIGAKTYNDPTPENPLFFPHALSWDGSVVVGEKTVNQFEHGEAARWTEATGLVGLNYPINYGSETEEIATGITANGSVIVGNISDSAFRWTESGACGLSAVRA